MKKGTNIIIAIILLLLYLLNARMAVNFENGNIPKSIKTETKDDSSVSFIGYDFNDPLLKMYNKIKEPKKIIKKYNYKFLNNSYLEKNVYTIKDDSLSISYKFKEKSEREKEIKKEIFKKRYKMFKNKNVHKIYTQKNSNIMQSSYIIEFKNKMSVYELYRYTSHFKIKEEEEMKVLSEVEFLSMYEKKESKYKRMNLVFTNKKNGIIFRNLVSNKLETEDINNSFELIYKKRN